LKAQQKLHQQCNEEYPQDPHVPLRKSTSFASGYAAPLGIPHYQDAW